MGPHAKRWLIRHRTPALLLIDLAAFHLALITTYVLRFHTGFFPQEQPPGLSNLFYVSLLLSTYWLLVFVLNGLYQRQTSVSRYEAFSDVFRSVFLGIIIFFVVSFTFDPRHPVTLTRFVLFTYGVLLVLFTGTGRALFRTYIRSLYKRRVGLFRSLIVGTGPRGMELARTLEKDPKFGHEVVAMLHVDQAPTSGSDQKVFPVSELDDLLKSNQPGRVEYVLIAMEQKDHSRVMEVIQIAHSHFVRVMIVPDFFHILVGMAKSRELYGVPLIEVFPDLVPPTTGVLKRGMDLAFALLVLLPGLPLLLVLALIVKLDSEGPVLFKQKRVGYRGKEYMLYKFRSMYIDAEARTGAVWATENDPRITRVGRFLRKTRLDELPQAWNVLLGQMSLVGPRPERPVFVKEFVKAIPFYNRRHNAKPGVTGWAQVRRGYDASLEDVRDKLRYDLFYLENLSIGLDIKILLNTVWVVLTRQGR